MKEKDFLNNINKVIESYRRYFNIPVAGISSAEFFNKQLKKTDINFSKLMRTPQCWNLLRVLKDRYLDAIFYLRYTSGEINLEHNEYDRNFLELNFLRGLLLINLQIVNTYLNFISNFFNLPQKNEHIDYVDIVNYLNIKDKDLAMNLFKLLFKNQKFDRLLILTKNVNANTDQITKFIEEGESEIGAVKFSFETSHNLNFSKEEIIEISNYLLNEICAELKNDLKVLKKFFPRGAFKSDKNATRDISGKITFLKKDSEEESSKFVKIYNLLNCLPYSIEGEDFILERNLNFDDLVKSQYKPHTSQSLTLTGLSYTEKTEYKSEGKMLWTHTLYLKTQKPSPIFLSPAFEEDLTLILSFLSASGVYTEENALFYSHKTSITRAYPAGTANISLDVHNSIVDLVNKFKSFNNDKKHLLQNVLTRYREIMQPKNIASGIKHLWEIVDVFSKHYYPKHRVGERYRRFFGEKLNAECKNFPILWSDLIPIMDEVYKTRGTLVHTDEEKNPEILPNYYFLLSDIVFILITWEISIDIESVAFAFKNVKNFIEEYANGNGKYYTEFINKVSKNSSESITKLKSMMDKIQKREPLSKEDVGRIDF